MRVGPKSTPRLIVTCHFFGTEFQQHESYITASFPSIRVWNPDCFLMKQNTREWTSEEPANDMKVLVLNSGSSSLKACLYEIGEALPIHPPAPALGGKDRME